MSVSFELAFPIGPVDIIPQDSNGRITEVSSSAYSSLLKDLGGQQVQSSSVATAFESNQSPNEPKKPPTGQKKSLLLDAGKGEKKKLNHFDGSPKRAFNMMNAQETPHFENQQQAKEEQISKVKLHKIQPESPKAAGQSSLFERVVATFPSGCFYSRNDFLKKIQQVNCRAFGKEGADALYLSLRVLSESEKQDLNLNIITGIEFIDEEYHTFILEGLAGKAIQE